MENIIEKNDQKELVEGKEYLISGDIGKYDSKLIGKPVCESDKSIKKVCFRTKLYDLKNGYIEKQGNSYHVKSEAGEYIVGEQGIEEGKKTSKTTFLNQICCHTALCEFLEPNTKGNKINLVLACPLSTLKEESLKQKYKELMKGEDEIHLIVDHENYYFKIENILIKAEGSGILYLQPEWFQDKVVAVIDFGGLNMGVSIYRNTVCRPIDRHIEEYGTQKLLEQTKEALTILQGGDLATDSEAETTLDKGYLPLNGQHDPETEKMLKNVKAKFVEEAISWIENTKKINLSKMDEIIFVGGTTLKLREQLLAKYPHAQIPTNANWSTAQGLYAIANAKYGK